MPCSLGPARAAVLAGLLFYILHMARRHVLNLVLYNPMSWHRRDFHTVHSPDIDAAYFAYLAKPESPIPDQVKLIIEEAGATRRDGRAPMGCMEWMIQRRLKEKETEIDDNDESFG